MQALISIHDVMPATLDRVQSLLDQLVRHDHHAITLLVVPGKEWQPEQVDILRRWQANGFELAAHGWHHKVRQVRGFYHRLHSLAISRDAAEHLALDRQEVLALMTEASEWFARQGLERPSTYVPPAWALGPVRRSDLRDLPYRQIEVTRGIIDTRSGRLCPLPLVGFEADTRLRAAFLRAWNRVQRSCSRRRLRSAMA